MRSEPNPLWDRVAGWLDGSDPRATGRLGWGAVAALAVAVGWSLATPDGTHGEPPPSPTSARAAATADPTAGRAEPAGPAEAACTRPAREPEPRPPGLSRFSPGPLAPGAARESTRWGAPGQHGLWGVAEVAECDSVRLDAVWIGPTGQKHRYRISRPGQSIIGVVANGLDGAISIYSVSAASPGRFAAILHISTDWGVTWEEREVPPSAERDVRAGLLSAQWRGWPVSDS